MAVLLARNCRRFFVIGLFEVAPASIERAYVRRQQVAVLVGTAPGDWNAGRQIRTRLQQDRESLSKIGEVRSNSVGNRKLT